MFERSLLARVDCFSLSQDTDSFDASQPLEHKPPSVFAHGAAAATPRLLPLLAFREEQLPWSLLTPPGAPQPHVSCTRAAAPGLCRAPRAPKLQPPFLASAQPGSFLSFKSQPRCRLCREPFLPIILNKSLHLGALHPTPSL